MSVAADATTPVILTRALGKVYAAGSEAEVVALRGVDVRINPPLAARRKWSR